MTTIETWTGREGLRFSHRIIAHPAPRFTPTMFVSGAFQTMDSWSRFARAFAPHTTVLLVDPPGMGASDTLPSHVGVEFLAECLAQVLDEHGIERVSVVAASYGTPSAFELARRHPARVDRCVLVGTAPSLPARLAERIALSASLARTRQRERLADVVIEGMLCHDPERIIERRDAAARVLRSGIMRMSDAELVKYAANTERLLFHRPLQLEPVIRGPEALVFAGEHDVFTPPDEGRRVATAFETSWFTTVRHADHLLHLQQWSPVIELLMRFIAREPGEITAGCTPLERVRAPACAA